MSMGNVELSKEAKVLLLQMLKQGYINPQQSNDLTKKINIPTLQVEIIDKTEQVNKSIL